MAEERTQRRLAAVLAADVVGYSRLMEQDESDTMAALKARRKEVLKPLVARYQGRIFKFTGDGVLAEFGSAVNAVQCAIDLQHGMAAANTDLPEARRIVLRIGVNLGDVMVEGSDLYGDGVNIAARLEGVAEPGGILISGTVFEYIRNKITTGIEDLGIQNLKNIAEPVRIYRITGTPRVSIPAPNAAKNEPSIAVLPFTNMSGDPEQTYFSDGITEDIITELSRFRALSVMARNSSFRFRGEDVDVVRVGRELNVQYVLEGSVRKIGNKLRISAQLINTTTGSHVWADRFDRSQDEIFTVQDQVVRMIVGTLAGRLQAAGIEEALRKPPASLAAYDCVLRADALPFGNPESRAEARRLSEKAIELDPTYGRAYAQLAISYYEEWQNDYSGSKAALDQAYSLASRAVALDGNDSNAHSVLGLIHKARRSYDLAEHCYQKAFALNPHRPVVMTSLGMLHGYLGRPEEGIAYYKQAKLIDQFYEPNWYWPCLGVLHFIAGQYDEAIIHLSRSPDMPAWVHGYLAACYALMDQRDQAVSHAAEVLRQAPDLSAVRFLEKEPFKQPSDRDRLLEALLKAGLPK
jgi:TolB-like protein/class 3 adenylate cyclase/tetratricopeptide (TPR) repeat protein